MIFVSPESVQVVDFAAITCDQSAQCADAGAGGDEPDGSIDQRGIHTTGVEAVKLAATVCSKQGGGSAACRDVIQSIGGIDGGDAG